MAKLAVALTEMGHPISPDTVGADLAKLGFSRQFNRNPPVAAACTGGSGRR
jgi:hypothetical protein